MRPTLRLTGILGCLLGVALLSAQEPQRPDPSAIFRRGDTDRDGKLSKAEFLALYAQAPRLKALGDANAIFARLDKDKDGFLSLDEFRALTPNDGPLGKLKAKAKGKSEAAPADGPAPTSEGVAFFEKKIRPVLADKCYSCHSDGGKQKGGLALDTRSATLKGGDTGPAIVPNNLDASLLLHALRGTHDMKPMPPKDKLSDAVVADFEQWVKMGAPDPRRPGAPLISPKSDIDIAKGREHWAFQPVRTPAKPVLQDAAWPHDPIDTFVLAKLEAKQLHPVNDADRRTLARRLAFDLTGLPPSDAELHTYLNDPTDDRTAAVKLVDTLLAKPEYGERWARHWLDVSRYAESSGKATNFSYPYAWRYRDYVIDAYRRDLPFDQFIREQLAGDLLPAQDDADRARHLVATGFLAIGPKEHNERNREQFQWDLADEQIDTTFLAFQGLTVACARCHDHKFDPIPQNDYYAVAGIFRSTETCYGTERGLQSQHPSPLLDLPANSGLPLGIEPLSATRRTELEKRLATIKSDNSKLSMQERIASPQAIRSRVETQQLESILAMYEDNNQPKARAMGARDRRSPSDVKLLVRGEVSKPAETVARGVPQVLTTKQLPKFTGSGRQELADFLASPDNPLTARVYANRVWQWLMGKGIVTSPDNFGLSGDTPSHPELLDHLARRLIANNWSTKKLIREIVLSRTYRLGSEREPAASAVDPDNALLWRHAPRRLDAEALRDAMLLAAGELQTGAPKYSKIANGGQGYAQGVQRLRLFFRQREEPDHHRSIYLPILRDLLPECLSLFDFPDSSSVMGERPSTTVPAQALYLMNNRDVLEYAKAASEKVLQAKGDGERVQVAYGRCLNRPATSSEEAAAIAFVHDLAKTLTGRNRESVAWATLCQSLMASAEFSTLR